jgi:hypothetical protein
MKRGSQARCKSLRELPNKKKSAETGISPSAEGLRHFEKGGRKHLPALAVRI